MKIWILFIAAFVSAVLVGYTLKTFIVARSSATAQIVGCHPDDAVQESKIEAATKEFAALHADPLYFQLKDPKGTPVVFRTPDGESSKAYEIKSRRQTKNFLLVFHEWYGLNDYIKQEADLLSNELDNVNVIALDLYDGKVANTADSAMKFMSQVNTGRVENIIRGAISYAGSNAKIYTIGWCFGGMWSLQASILAGKQASGCVMYYGRPETNIDKLKQLNADVIGFFGNLDKSITPEKVTDFENNMKAAGKSLEVFRYDAAHGFANPSNPVFNKSARDDAHQKTLAFLKARIKD